MEKNFVGAVSLLYIFTSIIFLTSCKGSPIEEPKGAGELCAQLSGTWATNPSQLKNTCPPPAYRGFLEARWNVTQKDSEMTVKIGDSNFSFTGPLNCTDEGFNFAAEYSYPDVVDKTCVYTTKLSINGTFRDKDHFKGPVSVTVPFIGGICDPGHQCQLDVVFNASRISSP